MNNTIYSTQTNPISRNSLPILLSAKEAEKIGITRSMYYRLINRADIPVVTLYGRKYLNRDRFYEWIDNQPEMIF